jgi:[acyl-carrier-protein] S-malonyltransferase
MICFLFPGQGAQYPGMGKDLWEASASVKELFALATDVTGMDLVEMLFEGTAEDLQATNRTQVAVTVVNLAAARVLSEHGVRADAYAGFSVGEYAALQAAGVISDRDVFAVVKARGELMEAASRDADTAAGRAGMAAVIGLTPAAVTDVVNALGDGCFAANYSSPKQVVIAGTAEGLDRAEAAFKDAGARRFVRLKVSGPFHSPLIDSAREQFADVVAGFDFQDPETPVFANVTGARIGTGAQAKELCVQQIVSSVRWVDEIEAIRAAGYTRFFETGPGAVLGGLMRAFDGDIDCRPAGTLEAISVASGQADG